MNHFVVLYLRRFGSVPLLVGLVLLAAHRGASADPPTPSEKVNKAEAKFELSRLKGEDLLKQARCILDKATDEYLAAVRALDLAELLLKDASRDPEEKKNSEPGKNGKEKESPPSGKAVPTVEEAKARAEAARQKLKRVQIRKELLDRVSTGNDGAQSAFVLLLNTLDDLKPYALEISLRVKDGSLATAAPADLGVEALDKKRTEVTESQARRKAKLAETQKAQEAIVKELDAANKSLLSAEAEVAQAGKTLAQEQKRQETEKGYANKGADALLADLSRLVEEGDGLKGSYELALARFRAQSAEADRLRKALAALQTPEVVIPQLTRAEDVEVAAKAIQELITFYTSRTQAVESLRTSLNGLVKQGGEFEADAAVSYDHLFKMRVVAGLLGKAGVAEAKYPDGGQPSRVEDAAERQSKSATQVQAGTENAKAELAELDKQLLEVRQAAEAARKQLQGLKQSQQVTTAVLKWEEPLRGLAVARLAELFAQTRKDLEAKLPLLQADEAAFRKSLAAVTEARTKLDGLKDPLLRKAEEEGQSERIKITGELRKEAGLDRAAKDVPAPPPVPAEAKKDDPAKPEKKGDEKEVRKPEPDKRTEMEKATESLANFQQTLAARVRVLDEREEKAKELLVALDDLQKTASAYGDALTETRRVSLQLNAAASEIKKRIGKGELSGDQIPPGVTDALRGELRAKLEADSAATLTAITRAEQDREALRRPDPDADALKVATKELLSLVGGRLDLLSDLKKLSDDYKTPKKDRPPSEAKRLEQVAADRQAGDAGSNDWLLGIDSSKAATGLEELLTTYYQELTETEEKNENLAKQKTKIDELLELARKETTAAGKILPLIDKQIGHLQTAQEEEFLLARAKLKPEQADELLKAYQTKSGKLLAKPVPFGDKEKSEKVDELGGTLFELLVRADAARRWSGTLTQRLSPAGIKGEAGVYQDELARVNALSGANGRRVAALTGVEPPEPGKPAPESAAPARVTSGEIGKTRRELTAVRSEGVKSIGVKIGAILLAAFLLPRIVMWVLRRAMGGGSEDTSLVLSAIAAFVKAGIWVVAFALVLSVLGFDVTAIIAGLGIGGLAIGLAAQPMISDVIAALVIFAERKFAIGDVIRMGDGDPARVIGLSWRSTQLRNKEGLTVNVPNRKITEESVQNLTKNGKTYDGLTVTVKTDRDVGAVLDSIRKVLSECEPMAADHGVSVQEFTRKGDVTVVKYQFWWFLTHYEKRNQTRDEVFKRISQGLEDQDMKGTEVTLA